MRMTRNQAIDLILAGLTIVVGLLWRSKMVPMPPLLFKYGGDALWAMVILLGVGFLFPRLALLNQMLLALSFAWAVEFLQLYHAPWIDAIRALRLGHLVLGTTFNAPDLAAYALGVALAGWGQRQLRRKREACSSTSR
jgi:hypothetical protein